MWILWCLLTFCGCSNHGAEVSIFLLLVLGIAETTIDILAIIVFWCDQIFFVVSRSDDRWLFSLINWIFKSYWITLPYFSWICYVSGILIVYLKLQYFVENAHFQIENNFYPLQSEQASLLPLQLHLVPKVIEINILDVEQQSKQKKTMLEIGGCMLSGKMPHWTSDDPEICSIIINSLIQRT